MIIKVVVFHLVLIEKIFNLVGLIDLFYCLGVIKCVQDTIKVYFMLSGRHGLRYFTYGGMGGGLVWPCG